MRVRCDPTKVIAAKSNVWINPYKLYSQSGDLYIGPITKFFDDQYCPIQTIVSQTPDVNGILKLDFYETMYEVQGNVYIKNVRNVNATFVLSTVSDISSENQTNQIVICGYEEITVVGNEVYTIDKTEYQFLSLDVGYWF